MQRFAFLSFLSCEDCERRSRQRQVRLAQNPKTSGSSLPLSLTFWLLSFTSTHSIHNVRGTSSSLSELSESEAKEGKKRRGGGIEKRKVSRSIAETQASMG